MGNAGEDSGLTEEKAEGDSGLTVEKAGENFGLMAERAVEDSPNTAAKHRKGGSWREKEAPRAD